MHATSSRNNRVLRETHMLKRFIPLAVLCTLLAPVAAQEKLDPAINDKIRREENDHSQIMRTLHFLTDVYGPRRHCPRRQERVRTGQPQPGVGADDRRAGGAPLRSGGA